MLFLGDSAVSFGKIKNRTRRGADLSKVSALCFLVKHVTQVTYSTQRVLIVPAFVVPVNCSLVSGSGIFRVVHVGRRPGIVRSGNMWWHSVSRGNRIRRQGHLAWRQLARLICDRSRSRRRRMRRMSVGTIEWVVRFRKLLLGMVVVVWR